MSTQELREAVITLFDSAKYQALALIDSHTLTNGELLTAPEVADRLKCSVEKVYEMRRDGRLPEDKDLGGTDRYRWWERTVLEFNGRNQS